MRIGTCRQSIVQFFLGLFWQINSDYAPIQVSKQGISADIPIKRGERHEH